MSVPSNGGVRAILFDLGKVILHFNFDPAFKRLARSCRLTPKDIEDYFVASGLEVLYDGGKISSFHFYREVKKALGFRLSYAGFKSVWNNIFTPNPAVIRLIPRLAARYPLVLISNTNRMHFEYIRRRYRAILKHFDAVVLSYEEKIRKPDPKIYLTARKACGARAEQIFYIDDRRDLTEAASALGFRTFTFQNDAKALVARMKKEGITL